MKQSRWASVVDTFGGTALGFVTSLGIQHVICWWYDLPLSNSQNLGIIGIFTVASLVRGFVWRRICEAFMVRIPMSPALVAIAAERRRQQDVEGFSIEHDDKHERGELAAAGACYALLPAKSHANICKGGTELSDLIPPQWPWNSYWWKPEDDRRNLVRAGALIVAELERLLRNRKRTS